MNLPEDPGYPWERQPGESPKAYDAFQEYLQLGPHKASQTELAKQRVTRLRKGTLEGQLYQIKTWSAEHAWTHRAGAWWDEQHRQARQKSTDTLIEMAQRHAEAAQSHLAVALEPARSVLAEIVQARRDGRDIFKGLSLVERVKLANEAAKVVASLAQVERLSRGLVYEQQGDMPARIDADVQDWTGDPDRAFDVLNAWADAGLLDGILDDE